jgi:hypothetical protein
VVSDSPKLRGRAASQVRTGLFIRAYLQENGEGAIIDIWHKLKQTIITNNMMRPKAHKVNTPTYESFVKYFGHVRRLRLVEYVRDEPMEESGHEKLLSIRGGEVAQSTRRIYRLSVFGADPIAGILWEDPLFRRLFREALSSEVVEFLKRWQVPGTPQGT